jgi:hypothetical protein
LRITTPVRPVPTVSRFSSGRADYRDAIDEGGRDLDEHPLQVRFGFELSR